MKPRKRVLTYANVVASLALFLAISGGVVYAAGSLGKNAVKSKNIAANAVKARNIAKNAVKAKNIAKNAVTSAKIMNEAVTAEKLKAGTLTRTQLASGTLAGLQIAEFSSASVPGLTTGTPNGTPIPLTGTTSFTPVAGKSYELLVELKGTPIDADGAGSSSCYGGVRMIANGAPLEVEPAIRASASQAPPFNYQPFSGGDVPLGLLSPGQALTLTAISFGSEGCGAGTAAALRGVVVEFG